MPPKRSLNTGGENPEFVTREFPGMVNNPAREGINDDDLFWLENLLPLAPANLVTVGGPSAIGAGVSGETTPPTYTCAFNLVNPIAPFSVISYIFAAFAATGNAYVINTGTGVATRIITGQLSALGLTYATQYGNLGLLIIDPNGYWDYNVTTANTLTSWNNTVAALNLVYSTTFPGNTSLTWTLPGAGSGATFQAFFSVQRATVLAAGTGYLVGDVLSLTDNSPVTPAQITVASIGAGGSVTGIVLSTPGSYPTPVSPAAGAVGPSGTVVTGGSGTGATFTIAIQALSISVVTQGNGYVTGGTPPLGALNLKTTGGSVLVAGWDLVSSGVIGGTSIATYGGRVWIGLHRTVYVTDINSYNSFGGVGFSFTVNDAYLANQITCLFSANNYLYLFGDNSIDAISNLTVTNGVSSFSRINVTTSVGTSNPQSVFGYYRAVAFFHRSGVYLLAGATPEKISDKISGIIRNWVGVAGVAGAQILIQGELCLCMQLFFSDVFTQGGTDRFIILLYFKGRWWLASVTQLVGRATLVNTTAQQGFLFTIGAAGLPLLYSIFTNAGQSPWIMQTKLWDGGGPLREKQALSAALAGVLSGGGTSGVSFTIDNERSSSASVSFPINGTPADYELMVSAANAAITQFNSQGSQYLGLTLTGTGANLTRVSLLALRGQADRDMMQ